MPCPGDGWVDKTSLACSWKSHGFLSPERHLIGMTMAANSKTKCPL